MDDFDYFLIVLGVMAALGPGYFIGKIFSSEHMSYWGYVWRGVWISVLVLIGLGLLFYFGVQMTVNE